MHRGWAQYSSDRRRRPRRRLFRSVELNVVGWSALLGATGVVAGAGAGVAAAWGRRPLRFAVAASSVVPVVLVVLDRRRAAKIPHSLSWGASPAEVGAVAALPARLRGEGIAVTVEPAMGVPIDVVDRLPGEDLDGPGSASLCFASGQGARVERLLRSWGIPVGPLTR